MTPGGRLPPSDAALLLSGSPEDFVVVCERHGSALRAWLRLRLRDGDLAAETLAEVFAAAWASRSRYRDPGDGSATPWLFGIATKQVALVWRRRRVATEARERIGMLVRSYESDPFEEAEARLEWAALAPAVQDALAALPLSQREALSLRVVDELDYRDVGDRLGVSAGAARTRVSRALCTLRSLVQGGEQC